MRSQSPVLHVFNSFQIEGSVQIKSYLAGNPPLRIKLNDDLVIARRDAPYGGAVTESNHAVVLDDCNFHEVRAWLSRQVVNPSKSQLVIAHQGDKR